MKPSRFVLLLLAFGLFLPAAVSAQTGAASLTGIVTDQSGAAVPGATVTATNQATNVDYTAVSNDAGNYTVTSLPVGAYVVKAELARFKTAATKPIQMEAQQIGRQDFKLELGGVEETVEVSSESQVLQTESATVGEVISGTTLTALPLNGRNSGQLSLLLPGVVTPNPSTFTGSRNFGGGRPYVNGNREQTNNYTIDGVDMNESIDNLVAYQPSPDALAQISVETNNYGADTGNVAGAVISNVIKSGTNFVRGNVFEFYRDSSMDANSWANNRSQRRETGADAAYLRRHARRPDREEQVVHLRQLPGDAVRRARVRDDLGGAGSMAPRRPFERHRDDQGSRHRCGLRRATRFRPAASARLPRRCSTTRLCTRCRTGRVTGVTGNLRGRDADHQPCQPGRFQG